MAVTCPTPQPPPPSYDAASASLTVTLVPDAGTQPTRLDKSSNAIEDHQDSRSPNSVPEPHCSKLFVLSSQPLPWRKRLYLTTWLNDTFDPIANRPSSSWLYEFVFPPCYENVYISPPILSRRRDGMPRYRIEMLGDLCGVQEEPIVVLRKVHSGVKVGGNSEAMSGDSEASRQAEVHVEKVCRLVAEEIGSKARHVESAKTAVDYHVKWSAISAINRESRHRMSSSVLAGSEGSAGLVGAEHLLRRLEGFLVFVGRRPEDTPCVERLRGDVERIRRRVAEMVKSQKSIMAGQ
ncbi:hypothetical protein LTR56_017647 [Elasticomyces elasticus]|nr:hypothetical protein LTR56_017647 [Elasticomyces elasticus]KAK3638577.1 hypothetical protein LTR22_017761 [Elasticomyces elasticus]KAK4913043.1 hypothetical protein LTR49_018601 [Elasticomyces elasticus]KAK5757603.1 hypothetical protein LTS12_012309 [Elasticomyces elasticus]